MYGSRRQKYSVDRVRMPARQGNMSIQVCANVDAEKALAQAGPDGKVALYDGRPRFAFRPSAPVGPLSQNAESDVKPEMALSLNRYIPRTTPIVPGAATFAQAKDPSISETEAGRRWESILQALDATLPAVGFPTNPLSLEGGALNSTDMTLLIKGMYAANNTSGQHLGVGDRIKFVHPRPEGVPAMRGSTRPEVWVAEDSPGTVNYQMQRLGTDHGTAAWFQRLLAGDGDAAFNDDIGSLTKQGLAGVVAMALLRLKGAGIIEIAAGLQGTTARARELFLPGAAGGAAVRNIRQDAGAVGGDAGAVVEALVGREGYLREALIPAILEDGALRAGDLGNAGEIAAVEPALATSFCDAVAGFAHATDAPGLYATVKKGGAPGDNIEFDIHGDRL